MPDRHSLLSLHGSPFLGPIKGRDFIPNEREGALYTFLYEKRCAPRLTSTARGDQYLASAEARVKALRASYAALRPCG